MKISFFELLIIITIEEEEKWVTKEDSYFDVAIFTPAAYDGYIYFLFSIINIMRQMKTGNWITTCYYI